MQVATATVAGEQRASLTMQPCRTTRVNDFRSWKNFVHDNFPWLEHRNHGSRKFVAEVCAYRFGSCSLSIIKAGASEVIRTRRQAETSEAGLIKLVWQMSGSMQIEQDNRTNLIKVGHATVFDTARPYRIRLSENTHFAVFMLPYAACPGWEHISQRICGARFTEGPAIRAALGALMGLTSLPHDSADAGNDTVVQAVQWMVSAALHRSAGEIGLASFRNVRLSLAQKHILDHIANPGLDVNDLAVAMCMSRRSLYMLFKEHDLTPGRMIHDVRLKHSVRILCDPCQQHRKITGIAFDLGFSDYATFSRLFKSQYGVTPREYRLKSRAARA